MLITKDYLHEFHFEDRKGRHAPFTVKDKAVNYLAWYWHGCPTMTHEQNKLEKLVGDKVLSEEFKKMVEQHSVSLEFMVRRYASVAVRDIYKYVSIDVFQRIAGLSRETLTHMVEYNEKIQPLCGDRDDKTVTDLEERIIRELDYQHRKNGLHDSHFVMLAEHLWLMYETGDEPQLYAYVNSKRNRKIPNGWEIRCLWEWHQRSKAESKAET